MQMKLYQQVTLKVNYTDSETQEIQDTMLEQLQVIKLKNRGRVSNFNQSGARKHCFLDSGWLKFETLPRKYLTLYYTTIVLIFIIIPGVGQVIFIINTIYNEWPVFVKILLLKTNCNIS